MLKEAKKTLVKNLTVTLQSAKSVVLVNYSGLNVKGQQELKKRLSKSSSKRAHFERVKILLNGKKSHSFFTKKLWKRGMRRRESG